MAGIEVVKEVKKAVVKGSAKFKNGKLQNPVSKSKDVAGKIKELLNNKENQKALQNNKKSEKLKPKKVADPSFRDSFANRAVKQIAGLERKDVDDKLLLKFKRNTIARLMVRTNSRFCAYRKGLEGERLTMRVHNDADEQVLMAWIVERVKHLKANVKPPKEPKKKV